MKTDRVSTLPVLIILQADSAIITYFQLLGDQALASIPSTTMMLTIAFVAKVAIRTIS